MSRIHPHTHESLAEGGKLDASDSLRGGLASVGGGSSSGAGSSPTSLALDDLTDATITSATAADRLRYSGTEWVNSAMRWEPLCDPSGSVVLTGTHDPVMVEMS